MKVTIGVVFTWLFTLTSLAGFFWALTTGIVVFMVTMLAMTAISGYMAYLDYRNNRT